MAKNAEVSFDKSLTVFVNNQNLEVEDNRIQVLSEGVHLEIRIDRHEGLIVVAKEGKMTIGSDLMRAYVIVTETKKEL